MAIYTRLGACMAIAAASMGLLGSTAAQAQPYPAKPVRIVVPLSPGGPVDVIARALGARLTEVWGQGVLIDNRPGVNEVVGAENVATSRGDGYTLFLATDPSISQNQFLYSKLPYDPINAFAPISRIATPNMALFVPASLPVNSAQIGVMRVAARPLAGRGIRVNTINPGPVDNAFQTGIEVEMGQLIGINVTEQLNQTVPLKRHADASEIAGAVLYFASSLSTYTTGTVHMVDGGLMS